MGIVSFIVDSANDNLSSIAESQFGLIASSYRAALREHGTSDQANGRC